MTSFCVKQKEVNRYTEISFSLVKEGNSNTWLKQNSETRDH
jgi:hypothetical protein